MATKTIAHWLSELPEDIAHKALAETSLEKLNQNATCMSVAMYSAFMWVVSTDGAQYWYKVYKKYCKLQNQQP